MMINPLIYIGTEADSETCRFAGFLQVGPQRCLETDATFLTPEEAIEAVATTLMVRLAYQTSQ